MDRELRPFRALKISIQLRLFHRGKVNASFDVSKNIVYGSPTQT